MQAMQQFLGACAFLIVAAGMFAGVQSGKVEAGSLADWAAAFGAVAAISVAVWAAQAPIRAEDRRRRAAKRDELEAIQVAVDMALDNIAEFRAAVRAGLRGPHLVTAKDEFKGVEPARRRAFEKILEQPLSTWPSATLYMRASLVHDRIDDLLAYMDRAYRDLHSEPGKVVTLRAIERGLQIAESEYRQALAGVSLD